MIDVALIWKQYIYPNTIEILTDYGGVKRVDCNQSLGKNIGSLSVELDVINRFAGKFAQNDSIELYASYSKLDRSSAIDFYDNNSSAFIFSGKIGSKAIEAVEGTGLLKLMADDKTITLTNMSAKRTYWLASNNYDICLKGGSADDSIVHQLISEINEDMTVADSNWDPILIRDDDIDTTGVAGIAYGAVFKTYAEVLTELASGAYTNDVQYTFWIDARNYFHWKKLGSAQDGDLVYGTDDIKSFSLKKEIYDVVNAAIINAGVDLNGDGIWWYAVNDASVGESGFRWTILADVVFSKDFQSIIYDSTGNEGFGTATSVSGSVLTDTGQSWGVNDLQGMWLFNPTRARSFKIASNTSNTITVEGEGLQKGEYFIYDGDNATFKSEMRTKAINTAKAELAKTAVLRWRGDKTLNGTTDFVLNQVYAIGNNFLNWTAGSRKKMRVTDVSHNISDGDWTTQLTIKEDIGTEGGQ